MSSAFRYRASTARGELVEGALTSRDEASALEELRRRELVPVALSQNAGAQPRLRGKHREESATVARTLATLLQGGAAVEQALEFAANECGSERVQQEIREVRRRVLQGETLSHAFGETSALGTFAPPMLRAAESSGQLAEGFGHLADHLERSLKLRTQLAAALMYPALMGFVSTIGIAVMLLVVVPRFALMLTDAGTTLPRATRILMGMSGVLAHTWWLVVASTLLAALAWRRWTASEEGQLAWAARRLSFPIVGELEHVYWNARFLRTFQLLLAAGDSVLNALSVARTAVENPALRQRIDQSVKRVSHGERIGVAFQGVLLPLASQLLSVGEEGGRMSALCGQAADAYESQLERRLKSTIALVEPGLIILFGFVVGFIALAMLQAIYSINASVL